MMNTNLLEVLNQITADKGEAVLENPRQLKAFFSDLAKDEPKPLRVAFGCCIETGAYKALKNAPDAAERASRKTSIAQWVRDEHGIDPALCAEALDILEAALFGAASAAGQSAPLAAPPADAASPPPAKQNAAPPPPSAPVCAGCGAELKANWKACPECGTPVQQAPVCAGCGAELKAAWKACPMCGTPVQAAAAAPALSAAVSLADAEAWVDRGYEHFKKKEYDRVIADCTEALRLNSNHAFAYLMRGNAYNHKGDYDRAMADYKRARKAQGHTAAEPALSAAVSSSGGSGYGIALIDPPPADATAWVERGNEHRRKKDYDRAIADYTEALRLNPNFADAYKWRGVAYSDKGDYDRAIADYTDALRIAPNDDSAYKWRGDAYSDKGDYDRAIADYTDALRIAPNDASAYQWRGRAYYDKGEYDRAIADYTEALRLIPNYAFASLDPNYVLAREGLERARKARGR